MHCRACLYHLSVLWGACRWQGVKPKGGPAGNPSVVLVQLDEATRQLQDLQEEAQQLAKVSACSPNHAWLSTH
jgi:hypothetical protein